MTTRLEVEHLTLTKKHKITKSRETLFEIKDQIGDHITSYGMVGLYIKYNNHRYGQNTDVIFDFKKSDVLKYAVRASRRIISINRKTGKGSQQIGDGITLFVASDLTKRSV